MKEENSQSILKRYVWDRRFLDLAKEISSWSKDPSTKVGAVIVRPDRSVCSVGFNGFARHVKDLPERYADRELKLQLTVHAEINAKNFAREPIHGYTLYNYPYMPCGPCTAELINCGIKRIVSFDRDSKCKWDFTASLIQIEEAEIELDLYPLLGV